MQTIPCEFVENVVQRMPTQDIRKLCTLPPTHVLWKSFAEQYYSKRFTFDVEILITKNSAQVIFVNADRSEHLTLQQLLQRPTSIKYLCIPDVTMANSRADVLNPEFFRRDHPAKTTLAEFRANVLPFILKHLICLNMQLYSTERQFQKLLMEHVKFEPNAMYLWLGYSGAESEEYLKAQIATNPHIQSVSLEGNWPQSTCALLLQLFSTTKVDFINVKIFESTIQLDINFFRAFIDFWRKNPKVGIELEGNVAFPRAHLGFISNHETGDFGGDYYCVYKEAREIEICFPEDDRYFKLKTK